MRHVRARVHPSRRGCALDHVPELRVSVGRVEQRRRERHRARPLARRATALLQQRLHLIGLGHQLRNTRQNTREAVNE
eukprot:6181596-Pleurochrysis_carterae.AAC.4